MKALDHHEHASVKDATAGAELTKQAKFVSIHASVKDATASITFGLLGARQKLRGVIRRAVASWRRLSPEKRIRLLAPVLRSFAWYYHPCDCEDLFRRLDNEIYHRMKRVTGNCSQLYALPKLLDCKKKFLTGEINYNKAKKSSRKSTKNWNGYG